MKTLYKKIIVFILLISMIMINFPVVASAEKQATEQSSVKFDSVSMGSSHSAAITEYGNLYVWGYGGYGQIGNGQNGDSHKPIKVMENVASVSLGTCVSAAITMDGDLYGWGYNNNGQLGNGTNEDSNRPIKIMEDVASVSFEGSYPAAITENGDLYIWGYEDITTPKLFMENISSVSIGSGHSAVITKDGDLFTWGLNSSGQLGVDDIFSSDTPIKVMENVASVSLGASHSAAITKDGDLFTWGNNYDGQLGDATVGRSSSKPVKIMEDVASVSLGDHHSAAITKDGELFLWGSNQHGQIGDENIAFTKVPEKIMENVSSVSLGMWGSAAITNDGALYVWGDNGHGQLGDGTTENSRTPVLVLNPDEVVSVAINKSDIILELCASEVLTATAYPETAEQTVTWSSSDDSVVSVFNGEIHAVKVGSATITAESLSGKTGTCTVTVVHAPAEVVLLTDLYADLTVGSTMTLNAEIYPATASQKIKWESNNTKVATVKDGRITALSAGTAIITATSEDGNASESCEVTVRYTDPTDLSLNKTSLDLTKGDSYTLIATVSPSTANQNVTWTSSNTAVATVSDGVVKATSAGTTTITAKSADGKVSASCKVTVNLPAATSVSIKAGESTVNVGSTIKMTATVLPSDASQAVTWKSSNTSVATITSDGTVTGKSAGTTVITATTSNGKVSSGVTITVKKAEGKPIYRLYLPSTGEHLYTPDYNEYQTLYKKYGWGQEGIAWYAPETGEAVYRLYQPSLKNHLYTTDKNEVNVLTSKYGWVADNNGKALYYSGGSVPIYRVYNKGLNGMHHLTTDQNEYNTLPKFGWKQEGSKLYATALGKPKDKTDFYNK